MLLTRYGAVDPAQSSAGVYTDPALNALYNQLLAKGMQSAQDALEVGILIEKKDIADLESALNSTTKFDIKRVYNNLMNGSYNHLYAFETVRRDGASHLTTKVGRSARVAGYPRRLPSRDYTLCDRPAGAESSARGSVKTAIQDGTTERIR